MTRLKKQGYFLICFTLLGLTPCFSMALTKKDAVRKKSVVLSNKKANKKSKIRDKVDSLKSYLIKGKRYYVLKTAKGYDKVGEASWYGKGFHGKLTASGERYDQNGMTAASPHLPLNTRIKVTNLANGRSVVVKVSDRGPFAKNRLLDLSLGAAKALGYADKGTARVRATVMDKTTELAQNNTHNNTQNNTSQTQTS